MTERKPAHFERMERPTVTVTRKIGNKSYTLYGSYKGGYTVLGHAWETMQKLKKKEYDVKYEETIYGIGKRKPETVTLIWVRK